MEIAPYINASFTPSAAPAGTTPADHLANGLYAYINADKDPELKKRADATFGRTVPFDNSETQATLIGRSFASHTGYRQNPVQFLRDNKLPIPPNWSGENAQLYTQIGQHIISKYQEHYNNEKIKRDKAIADAQKDITDSFNRLPEAIADSVLQADGITSHTALDKDLLQTLTKYNQGENALTAQKRAALAWQYIAPAFENVDHLQDTNRRLLLDIANALSDEKGQLDPHALAAFVMLTDKKATELQSTNSEFWADFADKFQNYWRTTTDQSTKTGIGSAFAASTLPELQPTWGQQYQTPAYYGDERVEKLYGYMNQAINTAISPSEKAEWYAKLLSEMGGLVGESIVPMAAGIAAGAALAPAGAFAAAVAGYGAGVAASAPSTINNAIGNAYIKGVINPELYGTLEGIGQAAAENIGGPATSLKLFTKTAGKLTNYAASRAAGSRFLANQYTRTTLNYLTAGAFESVTELAEEELGGFIGSKLNAIARSMGFEVSPQAYQLGETLKDMKSHEVAAIFGYSYTLGLFGVPANFRDARNFAKNTDNLLKAGHTAKSARDIQLKVFQTEDKIADIIANPSLTQEQKDAAIRKEEQSLASYQQSKFINDALSDPKLRSRLEQEGRNLRDEIEVALDVEHEADLQILKEHNILEAVVIPGEKYKVSIYEPGELQQDGTRAPGKITTQEWSRMQLTNWLMLQKDTRIEQDLRAFQSLLLSHAHAQSATLEETKTHFQNLGENRPLAALGELHKHGITPAFFQKAAHQALQLQLRHQQEGMTPQQAAQQPSPDFQGLSLGQVQSLATAASQRAEQEIATTGALQNITEGTSVEYGGINLLTADGTALIKYVAGRATILDMLEERFEADIKQRTRGNQTLLNQLAETLLHIQSHLPGNIQLLDPAKKGNYTKSDLIEAYSKIAIGAFLYNEKNLPINAAGHRLIQNIGRAVDTTRMYQTIGNAWLTYANSPEGKAHLEAGGQTIADIMQEAGFTFSNQLASARATAQQRTQVLESRNWQPAIEEELDALLEEAEEESQLAEINQQEAKEPITIPADQSITGKEIIIDPDNQSSIVNRQPSIPPVSSDYTPESHLRNLIQQGKATIRDFADFFKDHDITEAQATELGIRPLGQNGEPTYTYKMGLRLGIGMRFGTYTSEEQIQNFIIGALVNERVREIAGEDTTSYKLERKAEAVRKNARIFRDTASASRAKYNQAKAAGGSLPMPEAPQWPAPKKKADNSQDNIVNILAPMTSKDKYRDFLTVIHKETKDGITSYVATDGTRLSMLSRKASAKEDSHIVINPKTKEEDNAENYATLHWRQVIPTKADIETTIDLAPMLALKNFRKKGGTKAGFRLTSAGTTHRSVIIKAEGLTVFVDAFRFREAVEQLANLSKTLGFPSTVKLSLLKGHGPITLSASHNGWEWKAIIMPLSKADESAGDIILSEKPTILASVEKHSEDYIEKLRQDAEYDEAKAQEFEDEAANLEEQARMLASVEAQLPENDRLARWVASYFERPRMSAIFDVIKTIRSGDVQKFMPLLTNPENNLIRKLYEKISGTKLPKNTDDYKAAVDKWVSTLHSSENSPANFSIKAEQISTATKSPDLFTDGVLEAQNAIVTHPDVNFSIAAMHASPHNFRKFSTEKMGTGEGAQAYGWGLYFAESKDVNKMYFDAFAAKLGLHKTDFLFSLIDKYKDILPEVNILDIRGSLKNISFTNRKKLWSIVRAPGIAKQYKEAAKRKLLRKEREKPVLDDDDFDLDAEADYSQKVQKAKDEFSFWSEIEAIATSKANATNYRVELNVDDSHLLMWEKPVPRELHILAHKEVLLGNYEEVKDKVATEPRLHGHGLYKELRGVLGSQKAASEWLAAHGYKGIKYLDGNSRSAGEGTYNYVIFSGDDIKITAVNETGVWSMDEGWEPYTDPTANFSIRAANPSTLDRFTADPLGERIVHTVRTEARRYARVLGDKTPQEQAMNAIASAESIINAVDKYLHRPDKPVSRRHRNQLTKLRSIIEKYAQIIASGTPRSFKRISPAEQQELQAAIAELEAAELDTAETDSARLIEYDKRMNKRTREARSREHHRAIVREAAKGRVYKVLAAMLDTAADALDDYLKDQLLTKLHRLTATVAIKRTPSKRLKGKMTAPMYRELEQAIQLMAYSTRQKEDAVDTILTAHETLAQAIASNDDNLTRGNTLLIELAHQLEQDGTPVTAQTLTAALAAHEARVAIFADITSKNYEQTRTAANAIYHIIRYGRALWQQKHEAREAEIQTYLRHFLANTTAEQGKANAIRNMLEKFKWTDALSLNATMNAAQTLLALSSYEPLRPIIQQVLENYATASVARQKHLQEMRKQELYLYARILGIKPATQAGYSDKQLREISDKFDTFYAENNQTIQTDITVTWQERNADGILETHTSEPLSLTKWEALNLILTYRQQDYQTNAQLHGYTDTVLDKLEKLIGTDLMDFGNGIQQALINDGTIAVYEEREGIPMRNNPLYWPGNININTLNTTREEPLVNPYHPAAGHDFLHTRVRHRNEIAHLNAFTVWRKAVADRANYIYSDPVTSHLESLLARQQFAGRLKTLIGEGLYRQLKATIAEIKNASWQETTLQDVNNTIIATAFASKSLAVLSGNPSSLVRQLSAVANAGLMPGLTPDKYLQYAIGLKQGQGHIGIRDILQLDSFTTRQRDNAYVNEMLAMGNDVKFSRLMDWAKAGMNAMDKLDLLANAFSAAIVYNHKYDELKALGTLTEDQIKKQCENAVAVYTKLLAQPLNRTDKSALYWQLGNHALGRAVLFMSSESINKIGMLRANYIRMRNQGKNPAAALGILLGTMGITVGLTAAITEAALAILTGSLPDDDDNIAAWATALWINASYGQYLGSLPLIGGVSDSIFSPYGGYFSGDLRLPGQDTIRYGGKLIEMLTDNKTYTAAQWEKETTRLMRDFTAVLGFAGGAYSRWQWYSNAAAFSHSLTAALNVLYPIARGVEAHTGTRKPRRSKSKIEKWLTPDNK